MADIADVEQALVNEITAAVYPGGPGTSIIGADARIYRGWPNGRTLDADLAAGLINITVFPQPGMTRNTTRFPLDYLTISVPTPTITVSTADSVVTFAGAAGVGNLCGIRQAGIGYAYAALATDGPTQVAAALAALVPGAFANGPAVTVAAGVHVRGRVVAIGTALQETRRQVQGFMITCWCPNTALRDQAAGAVDNALAPIEFLTLADGTGGRLLYHNTRIDDVPTKDALWRRDLIYSVEYGTTRLLTAPQVLWPVAEISTEVVTPGGHQVSSMFNTSPP